MTQHELTKIHVQPWESLGYYICIRCNDHGVYKDVIERDCPAAETRKDGAQ